MEPFDFEAPQKPKPDSCYTALRRFLLLAICLLEPVAICLLIYLLLNIGRIGQNSLKGHDDKISGSSIVNYRIFSDESKSTSVRLLPRSFGNCTLRQHDLPNGVKCESSQWYLCAPVERHTSQTQLDIAGLQTAGDAPHQQVATLISTTKRGRRLFKERIVLEKIECKPQLEAHLDPCRFSTRLVVDVQQRHQQIIGWGGALTDSSAQNILSLTTNGTRRLLDDYFGEDGLRYNIIRITIGGSDFSSRFYTNDDSMKDDLKLENFKLREEDLLQKIPILNYIKEEYGSEWLDPKSLKVFASMWSPPLWMKTNAHFNKGQLKGSITSQPFATPPQEEAYFNALAELKIKFMLAYQQQTNMKFWGLTVMNEPLFSVQPFLGFNTMIFPRDDYANYVAKYLGPKLRQNQDLKTVKLIAHDDNRRYLTSYTMPILNNPESRKFIDGVATHSYADEAYGLLDLVSKNSSGLFVLPTELCSGHLPFMEKALIGNWDRGIHYGLDIIRSLRHSAAGWVDWNLVLDTEGGPGWLGGRLDAPIIVDKQADKYYKSPMFYVLGQFSRYIPPGSVKLHTKTYNEIYDNHFEVVTFAQPQGDRFVTVILNNNPYPIKIKLKLARDQKNLGPMNNIYYKFTCESDSVSTLIYSNKL